MVDYHKIEGFFTYPTLYQDMLELFPSGSLFVEVGSYLGKSVVYLVQKQREMNKKMHIVAIDHFRDQSGGMLEKFKENISNSGIDVIVGESTEIAKDFEDSSIDFLFIDAAHDYESVKADIEAWLPKVRGIIAGHDYPAYPGVVRAVHEIFGQIDNKYEFEGCWMVKLN